LTRVYVIADASLYAEGLASLLADDTRLAVMGTAHGWPEGLAELRALQRPPDVVLLDLDTSEGLAAVRALTLALPQPRLVALVGLDPDEGAIRWAEAGVAAVLSRDASVDDVVQVLQAAAQGWTAWSPKVAEALMSRLASVARSSHAPGSRLTSREREIVALIDRGLSNKEIASELQIELPTVKNHVHNVLSKLNAARRGEAAAMLRGERPIRG
jgi:two-component system, NarL family, nitrate/nitrite response regulator NarL